MFVLKSHICHLSGKNWVEILSAEKEYNTSDIGISFSTYSK